MVRHLLAPFMLVTGFGTRACRGLGIPFIGISKQGRARRLSDEGAVCVLPDFSDMDIFLRSVDEITNAT